MTPALPKQLVLETVSVCNLRCPSCFVGAGMTDRAASSAKFMDYDLVDSICSQVEKSVGYTYPYLWGEPTLHKDIGRIIARIKRFSKVSLSTHGMFVSEDMAEALMPVDALSVSIDGLDQETYQIYRIGGDFDKAWAGLELLARKRSGNVIWEWVVHQGNEHQIDDARKVASKLGVTLNCRRPLFITPDAKKALEPKDKSWLRYDAGGAPVASRLGCREFWETIYFLPNGDCMTCCYDHNADWVVGNAYESSVEDIWRGAKYQAMRDRHTSGSLNELCDTQCHLWDGS